MARTLTILIERTESLEHGKSYTWEIDGGGFPVELEDVVATLERLKFILQLNEEFGAVEGGEDDGEEGETYG